MNGNGKLSLPKNLGIKNQRGADHKDMGRGTKGGKLVKTPVGANPMKPGKAPRIKK